MDGVDEFCPSIGLIGADGVDLETLFVNLLIVSPSYIYGGIRNCLVVQRIGRYLVLLAHMGNILENGLEPEARRLPDLKLILFFSYMQTREHSHAVASLYYVSLAFW